MFPASQTTLADALYEASAIAIKLKNQTQSLRNDSASGATGRMAYLTLMQRLSDGVNRWQQLATVPGIGAYAQSQYGDGSLDIAAEFTAMRNAAISLRDWIGANFPIDGSGAVLVYTKDAEGFLTELTISSAATATFRANADAFIATVG